MSKTMIGAGTILKRAAPFAHQQAHEIQPYGHVDELHLLFDKHYDEQNALVDAIAERADHVVNAPLAEAV